MTRRSLIATGAATMAALLLPARFLAASPDFCAKHPNHWRCRFTKTIYPSETLYPSEVMP